MFKENWLLVMLFLVVFAGMAIAVGNTTKEPVTVSSLAVMVQQQQQKIESLERDNKSLSSDFDALHRRLEKNWRFTLGEIDDSLDAVERGDKDAIRGSYSDWFGPTLHELKARGVGTWRLQIRIDRLLALAEKGKYLSPYEHELVKDGGMKELKSDTAAILQ